MAADKMAEPKAVAGLDEIRALLRDLSGPDRAAAAQAAEREAQLAKPQGALGRLEAIASWCATWQGKYPPTADHPRVALFAGSHAAAAASAARTAQLVKNIVAGGAAVNQLCRIADADLRIYEMNLDQPVRDFTVEPAMSEDDGATAIAYGMMAVEPGVDLLAIGAMGIGSTTAAAALACALFGGDASAWSDSSVASESGAVRRGVALHRDAARDPLDLLCRLGGREFAAIVGAAIAARRARVPVLLDGYAATAAAAVLFKADASALDHCLVAQRAPAPGHRLLVERLGMVPLLDLGIGLDEAAGAALAIPLVKAAVACHRGMASFAEAGIDPGIDRGVGRRGAAP
ncbi:MAG TPA: nicotinate-nucleotide--dimethylbenzimidazole phosphoribosyltransferase [Stellaceae bacterium]|nr:nicotinate-nucleotide--dimethylbenzimidazole phosphoribosyltransferase [Stellaceae bacterium]